MQFGPAKPPRGILFDSSFGQTIDTVLALALLHGFDGRNQARIAALSSSKPSLKSAQLCDVIEKFYASATTGLAAIFFQGMPIGLATDAKAASLKQDTPIITEVVSRNEPRVHELNQTAPPEVLMRNALTAQYDGNAAIVLAGPASNLARLLALRGAKDLVAKKVRFLVIADGEPDFVADVPAAKRVISDWPTPMVLCGREVGEQLLFPGKSIEEDFAYNPAHPVAEAYRANHAMPYDAPTWAMAAALYAVKPDDGYFKLSEPGEIIASDDGRASLKPAANARHRRLLLDAEQKDRILKTYTELASAKPVPRNFRFRQVADDQDAQQKVQ